MDELTNAAADEGYPGDGRESGATADSQLDPLGGFERGRASFSLAGVLLAMTVASIMIAVIRRAVARRREPEEALDQIWWVPVDRAPADAKPGTEQHDQVAVDARPRRAPSRAQAGALPTRRGPRERAAANARPRQVPRDAPRRGAPRQPRLDVGGPPSPFAGGNSTAPQNRAVRPTRVQGQSKLEQPPAENKPQPLDRRWLTRLPVRKSDS